jgi:hypothetical protein
MNFNFGVQLPKAWEIFWRASSILKKRRLEAISSATKRIRLLIDDFAETRLNEEVSDYLTSHANNLLERGGWELQYFPDRYKDFDGTYRVSRSDVVDLLENWPDRENLPDGYPTELMSDADALGELLCSEGWIVGDIEGYENISDAECFAILAQEKIAIAQGLFQGESDSKPIAKIHWSAEQILNASALITEAMECICIAERHVWDTQMTKLSAELHQRQELEMRRDIRKSLAQAAARQRVATDPKQVAKQQVRECWDIWKGEPSRYKSKSAFAKDMLSKFEQLESSEVIQRWCREWDSELSKQS